MEVRILQILKFGVIVAYRWINSTTPVALAQNTDEVKSSGYGLSS